MKKLVFFTVFMLAYSQSELKFDGHLNLQGIRESHAAEMFRQIIASFPQKDQSLDVFPEVSSDMDHVTSVRSFELVRANGFYKQPKGLVKYKIELKQEATGWKYHFSEFKIYPYERNRYGVFEKKNSKGYAFHKLGKTKQKEFKPLIAQEIAKYMQKLQNAGSFVSN